MTTGRPSNRQTIEQKKRYTITETGWEIAESKKQTKQNTIKQTNKRKRTKLPIADFGGNNFFPFKSERALSSVLYSETSVSFRLK